jgi:amino acid transporter
VERAERPATLEALVLRRGINPLALFATMFVLLCGGPFGIEEIVPLAGPGLTALALLIVPIVWALPLGMLIAEMVSALPLEGGSYQWYRASLGPFWAFVFTYLEWLSWAVDAALYPALVAGYLLAGFFGEASLWARVPVCLAVIWGCAWLNVRGVREVGVFSIAMTVVILVPSIAMTLLALPEMRIAQLAPLVPDDHSLWTSLNYAVIWATWSYSGYSGLAAASEEIITPERSYPKTLAIFVPITVAVFVLPLWAALAADPDWRNWGPSHLSVAAGVLGGGVLAALVAGAAQLASIGHHNGEQLILGRFVYAMARDRMLPPVLAKLHPRYGTPHVSIYCHAALFSVLTLLFDFVELLVLVAVISVPTFISTSLTPLILRARYPKLRGAFRVPGGWPVLIPMALSPTLIALYILVSAEREELLWAGGMAALAPLLYWAARAYNRRHGIADEAPSPLELKQALERAQHRADGEVYPPSED